MLPSNNSKPASNASAKAFVQALLDEHRSLLTFTKLLQIEQSALVAGDADGVAALSDDKAAQVEALNRFNEQRNKHLSTLGLDANPDGMQVWLDRHPEVAQMAGKIWKELLLQAETARQLNQDNGALIENRLQQNRLKLAVLQTSGASDSVYHADGRLSPLRSARSFN